MCRSRISATFLRSSSRSRWIGFLPTTPVTLPVARVQHHALADQDLRVPAADGREPQIALVVDVRDDQPDLVDVPHHEQSPRRAARVVLGRHERQRRADHVGADLRQSPSPHRARPPPGRSHSRRARARRAGRAGPWWTPPLPALLARFGVALFAVVGLMWRGAVAGRTAGYPRGGNIRPLGACRSARAPRSSPARVARARAAASPAPLAAGGPPSFIAAAIPSIEKTSSPVNPSESALCPSGNCSGSTPMPTRFERWMRSKLSTITARTPSSFVPLAAQSREEPEPYSLPPSTTSGTSSSM